MALSAADRDAAIRKILGPHGSLREAVHDFERRKIIEAIEIAGGNKKDAAIVLGICREGLHVKIRTLGMKKKLAKGRNGA